MFSKEDESKQPATALVNVQLRNSMALLRRCCNHPYLIEHPMDDGQLRIDEALVTACGKLMLLDRMLTELKKNGHKVYVHIYIYILPACKLVESYMILKELGKVNTSKVDLQISK